MSLNAPASRPLACLKSAWRLARHQRQQSRSIQMGNLVTMREKRTQRLPYPPREPPRDDPWAPQKLENVLPIKLPKALPSIRKTCAEPLKTFNASQLALLDPSGSRTRLFAEDNADRAALGDILLVRFKNGDPFFGVLMAVRRRATDTGILLRNTVMRVSTEMWVKIYNPAVAGIEIVQRAERKARRARLHYLRKPEHDRGDLSGILNQYLKTRRTLGARKKDRNEKLQAKKAAKIKAKVASEGKKGNPAAKAARSKGKAEGR